MEKEAVLRIEKLLRGYDLMLIETGGKYDGKGILSECSTLSNSFLLSGGCLNDLYQMIDSVIEEYQEMQRNHQWKYFESFIKLLNAYKNQLDLR
jgi:hypothetical protein